MVAIVRECICVDCLVYQRINSYIVPVACMRIQHRGKKIRIIYLLRALSCFYNYTKNKSLSLLNDKLVWAFKLWENWLN